MLGYFCYTVTACRSDSLSGVPDDVVRHLRLVSDSHDGETRGLRHLARTLCGVQCYRGLWIQQLHEGSLPPPGSDAEHQGRRLSTSLLLSWRTSSVTQALARSAMTGTGSLREPTTALCAVSACSR